MKLNLKKILVTVAIGLSANMLINSNSNVFAATKSQVKSENLNLDTIQTKENSNSKNENLTNEDSPKNDVGLPLLVDLNNKIQDEKLVIVTCVDNTYVFNIPVKKSSSVFQIQQNDKFTIEAKSKDKSKTVKAETKLESAANNNPITDVLFEMSANELTDNTYDFEIKKNEKQIGTFKNVKIKKEEHTFKPEDSLAWFDQSIILDKNNEKTNDHMEGCYSNNFDEFEAALIPDSAEIKELSEKLEGKVRESILKNHENIILIYKDMNTNEKILEKNLKFTTDHLKTIDNKTFDFKAFKYSLKNSEIPFNKIYKVEIFDKNKNLVGTLQHDLTPKFVNHHVK